MSAPDEYVAMTFDPELKVNVRPIIEHMAGRRTIALTVDQWDDMKEQVADMLEQFLAIRSA